MKVAVVGVCASGKSTLVKNLRKAGIDAYSVSQEHSCVKKLWNHQKPDFLVVLDVSIAEVRKRRTVRWGEDWLVIQRERLSDARSNADLFIQTDDISPKEACTRVLECIERA